MCTTNEFSGLPNICITRITNENSVWVWVNGNSGCMSVTESTACEGISPRGDSAPGPPRGSMWEPGAPR